MKKIISLFKRAYDGTHQVHDEIAKGAEWVINGEGTPTVKIDGSCCMVRDGILYKRYDRRLTKSASRLARSGYKGTWTEAAFRPAPAGWTQAEHLDSTSGRWGGWLKVDIEKTSDKFHIEAIASVGNWPLEDGTYELVGPKVQGNPYKMDSHKLVQHGDYKMKDFPRTFDEIRNHLVKSILIEGVVWHHPDGRMVKIKRKDFGLPWPAGDDSRPSQQP
jgi:hypothetical protein